MSQSNYPFLARNQKTEEERQRENIGTLWDQLGSMGITGRQSFFTGYGNDGKLQEDRPTGVLDTTQGPRTVHEGEQTDIGENGEFSVTPASQISQQQNMVPQGSATPPMETPVTDNGQGQAQGFSPASQFGGQEELKNIEQEQGIQGYQIGTPDKSGFGGMWNVKPDQPVATPPKSAIPSVSATDASSATNTSSTIDTYQPSQTRSIQRLEKYADSESPVDKSIREGERERFSGEAVAAKGALSQELAQSGVSGREAATEQSMLGRQIGAQESEVMKGLRKEQSDKSFAAAQQLPGATATARSEDRMREGLEFTKQQWGDTEGQRMLTDAVVMDEATWLQKHPQASSSDYTKARDEATLNQRQVSLSERKWDDAEGQRALTDSLSMSEGTWLQKHPGMTAADYAAARDESTLNQQNFDLEREKYKDVEGWREYEAAIAAGSFDTAAAKYSQITGGSIDMNEMKRYQNYLIAKQGQDVMSGDLNIDAQRLGISSDQLTSFANAVNSGADLAAANEASGLNLTQTQFDNVSRNYTAEGKEMDAQLDRLSNQLGQEKYDSMMDRINSGASLDMINEEFGTQLNAADFQNMRSSTPFGQQQWERSLSAAGMLMQTQTPENMLAAAKMYEELFPGATFNMESLIKEVGADKFAKGMTDLATLAATFDTWSDAQQSADRLNLFDSMGLTQDEAQDLFRGLKINQIDEEWKVIEGSDFYKKLDTNVQELIQDTFSAGLSGELEFDITPTFKVMDNEGRLVTQFDSVADANKYLGENADKEYVVEEGKNYVYKDMGNGSTVVVNNGGEVVSEDGGDNKTGVSVKDDAWDYFQDSLGGLPDTEIPTYTEWEIAWEEAGSPSQFSYEQYVNAKGEPGRINYIQVLDDLILDKSSDLLLGESPTKLASAWAADPDTVRKTDYYYKFPTTAEITAQSTTQAASEADPNDPRRRGRTGTTGKVDIPSELTTELNNNIGKIVELTDKDGREYSGQMKSYSVNDSGDGFTVSLRTSEGKTIKVLLTGPRATAA